MYTQQELDQVKAQIRRRWLLLAAPLALCLAVIVWGFVRRAALFEVSYDADTARVERVITVALAAFGLIFIAGWDLLIKPLRSYARHMDDMLNGITHQVECDFRSFEPDTSTVEGVVFRTMNVVCTDDAGKPYDRIFYYDAEKPLPGWQEGQHLRVTFHDRQVAAAAAI